jgi:hypothetical protein
MQQIFGQRASRGLPFSERRLLTCAHRGSMLGSVPSVMSAGSR